MISWSILKTLDRCNAISVSNFEILDAVNAVVGSFNVLKLPQMSAIRVDDVDAIESVSDTIFNLRNRKAFRKDIQNNGTMRR